MSTVGENIKEVEKIAAETSGTNYAVALSCGTAALHLCMKLAGEKLYGKPPVGVGALYNKRVFCTDMTFNATLNPVVYEGGIPVFIDTEYESWGMNPAALEKAFEMYPEVKLVVYAELYGFPGNVKQIKEICEKHGALLVEDAAEADGSNLGRNAVWILWRLCGNIIQWKQNYHRIYRWVFVDKFSGRCKSSP